MKTTKFQRLTALLLCLIFALSCFSVNAVATDGAGADGDATENDSNTSSSSDIYNTDDMIELLGAISYGDYMLEHAGVSAAEDTIVIDAVDALVPESSDAAYSVGEFDGIEAVKTPGTGAVSWKVTVPKTAKYTIMIKCYANDDGKANSVERVFRINNKVPFSEARYITIKKTWASEFTDAIYDGKTAAATVKAEAEALGLTCYEDEKGLRIVYPGVWTSAVSEFCDKYGIRFMTLDINKNELRPSAVHAPAWEEYTLTDSMGFYTQPFEFVLNEGENILTLEGKNGELSIDEIVLTPAEDVISYEEYLAKYANKPAGSGQIKLEGEYMVAASDKTVYPIEDAADANTSPSDPSRTVLNMVGGEKWQTAGQWVTYKVMVDESGMYDMDFRFRQNILDGMFTNRSLYIYSEGLAEGADGYYNGLPFAEAKALTFNFSDDWQATRATDGKQEFKFYFEKGVVYTIKLEVTLGDMGEIINTVQNSLNSINTDYLSIIQLTGATPDTYRDYGFSRIMPDTLIDMVEQAFVLNYESEDPAKWGVAQQLTELAGQKSSNVGTLQKVSDLLLRMGRDEDEIARSLERLKAYIGTLGTFLSDAKTQPLELDYIMIQPAEEEVPAAKAGFWASLIHEVRRFFYSFVRDYDNVGAMVETTEESLQVWLATGRDQAQVKRNLVNNGFTPSTGISVELKLVAGGTLLPSILAKQGPDVYHGLGQGDVINYAIRSAIIPIYSENPIYYDNNSENGEIDIDQTDFKAAAESFNESAMIVLGIEDSDGYLNYYGLPEAQGFAMMFVRVDILADLGLEIPRTWEDIMEAVPVLQSKNMEIGITTDTNIHLYQQGGTLFADNGMRINLDSKIGLASFRKMCEFFTKYGFPYTYDAANRFRTGEMPILIGDYTGLYNQLKVFATEIEGLWAMVPVPGVEQADGTVNNCAISSVSASVMVRGAEENSAKAWTYIKWFTGDECQAEYANEMVAIMGPSAKYNTANIKALANLPWTTEEYTRIKAQFDNLASVPNYPGSYIIGRYTDFAFLAAYNDNQDPTEALLGYIYTINKEITRKRAEFGLETLEQGETLASKRLAQAEAAAEELKDRNASYSDVYDRVMTAVKSEDDVTLNNISDEIMAMTSESLSEVVRISKGPDIGDLSNEELLYYIAVALSDAAAALLTY
ncbi:MAG: extracellular solute-binding protein [Clostridia bacterium]|nr:extracellular solute-binding protein [Clostridia bacterium]